MTEDQLQSRIVTDFLQYARLVGPERTKAFVTVLDNMRGIVSYKSTEGQDEVGSVD
jgi:hypothetical protein